jgi:hypothetical protein
MSETEEHNKPERMIIAVAFDDSGDPHKDFDEIMRELRVNLSHKPNTRVYGAIHHRAQEVIDVLERPDEAIEIPREQVGK